MTPRLVPSAAVADAPPVRHSAVPLALFRILFGACLALDVAGLWRDAPLWFDEVPFARPAAFPVRPALAVWWLAAVALSLGAFTRIAAILNYAACVGFLGCAAMGRGYEYHNDGIYLLCSFGALFLPVSRVLSIDAVRRPPRDRTVGRGPEVFLALVATSIYLDSTVWKLSSRMWIEGLGYWTPASQPWTAPLSVAWTLEHEWVARAMGYVTLVYELLFGVLVWFRRLRWPLLGVGFVLHAGIALLFPLPLFGLLMVAVLAGLLPWPVTEQGLAPAPAPARVGRFAPAFLVAWAVLFVSALVHPSTVLARHGLGGLTGEIERPWHSTSDHPLAPWHARALAWSYRLLGIRSHPIFLDSQFTQYAHETRLRYHPPGTEGEGEPLGPALRNRLFVSWTYHMTWPLQPRAVVERSLVRFVEFAAGAARLDLERGRVTVEQRPIRLHVDAWQPGVRARNVATPWRGVAHVAGSPGALRVAWDADLAGAVE